VTASECDDNCATDLSLAVTGHLINRGGDECDDNCATDLSLSYCVNVLIQALLLAATANPFAYDRSKPFDVQVVRTEVRPDGIEVRDITFAGMSGNRTEAYLVVPPEPRAGILYVHWYEPPDPTSNRTQFVEEAVALARDGVVSLLPATMWSDFDWFRKRSRSEDLRNSINQLKELRRALDVLASQPGVRSMAYVGHDFGAMFGAVLAGIDRRPIAWALQAGTPRFSNWYLFGPPMPEPSRSEFIESLRVIDPVTHIGKASPAPVLLQFAARDIFVPHNQAEEFWRAARQPKEIVFYDAEHKMNDRARVDRIAWLRKVMKLTERGGTGRRVTRTPAPPRE
jgi:pimeloyl-ACP methyl ester carboxylesterase